MGTWGIKTFEDDGALDWAMDLVQMKDDTLLKKSLNPKEVDGYLEAPDGVYILCASEVIAGIAGKPRSSLPDNVGLWIAEHKKLNIAPLITVAIVRLQRVLAKQSELDELWVENKEDYSTWKENVIELSQILKSLPPQAEIPKRPWWKFF